MLSRYAVYACSTCNAMTLLADADVVYEAGEPEPLGFCALVREPHGGEVTCLGDITFKGYISLDSEPVSD